MFEKIFERRNETRSLGDVSDANFNKTILDYIPGEDGGEINENTYFTCLNEIANGICKLDLKLKRDSEIGEIDAKEHYLYNMLYLRPNSYMNTIVFLKTVTLLAKHYGIAGIFVERNSLGKITGLFPSKIDNILIDDAGLLKNFDNRERILYYFSVGNHQYTCLESDMILIKDISFNGIEAKSIKTFTRTTIKTSKKAQNFMSKFYDAGLINSILLTPVSDIKDPTKIASLVKKYTDLMENSKRVKILPPGFDSKTLDLKLTDSQFLELKKLSRDEIRRAMGCVSAEKPSESEEINFLQNTLLPFLRQIEQEMDWKLLSSTERDKQFYKIRFDLQSAIKMSPSTHADVLVKLVTASILTVNNARAQLGLEKVEGGDDIIVNSGVFRLRDLNKVVENNSNTSSNNLDNIDVNKNL